MSVVPYRRLPGTRRGVIARSSVWAGRDHILLIEGSRVKETYKRVYYRDIQAILLVKRSRFIVDAWFWLIIPALIAGTVSLNAEWWATAGLAAGLTVLAVLLYLYISATVFGCRLYLATAVGNVQMTPVYRTWRARKFIEQVRPLILDSQRDLKAPVPPPMPPPEPLPVAPPPVTTALDDAV